MLSMAPYDGLGYVNSFVSAVFRLHDVDNFAISCIWTAGIITVQYSHTQTEVIAGTWYALDATQLVFTAAGARTVKFGGVYLRAIGDSSSVATSMHIEGFNVSALSTEEQAVLGLI